MDAKLDALEISNIAIKCGILDLPTELHLNIATCIVGDAKNIHHARHLVNLALTCRKLAPVAQEALCLAPILQSRKVVQLLRFLFTNPKLASRIGTLTIETRETQTGNAFPMRVARLDPQLLDHCKRHILTMPVGKQHQDTLIGLIRRRTITTHGPLLALILTMLPNLKRLYTGGSILLNLPFLRAILRNPPTAAEESPGWDPTEPDLSWVLALVGPQLTALELPIDLRRSARYRWTPPSVSQLPEHCPNLTWLSVPQRTIAHGATTTCADLIPRRLSTLVLSDAQCKCLHVFNQGLHARDGSLMAPFSALRNVTVYHRCTTRGTNEKALRKLATVGVELVQHIQQCYVRPRDAAWHPWKYEMRGTGLLDGRHRHDE